MYGVSRAEEYAEELIRRLGGEFVSRRDGHVIIKVREGDATVIIWVRQSPITEKALNLFKRMISKHSYDKLVLVKLYDRADYVKHADLNIFSEIKREFPTHAEGATETRTKNTENAEKQT